MESVQYLAAEAANIVGFLHRVHRQEERYRHHKRLTKTTPVSMTPWTKRMA